MGYVCVGCGGVYGVGREWGGAIWDRIWEGGVVLILCELRVVSLDILCCRSRYLYIVLGGYLCILGSPSGQSCCTLSISAS